MILFKRRHCRKHGHDLDPNPCDFVLHCLRCQTTVDMLELAAPLKSLPSEDGCRCDIFDMGPRCDFCVAQCTAAGHPYTEDKTNGQHHQCGLVLRGAE